MYGIILVAVIAIIAGLLLSWASIQFAVPVDEKQAAVREVLPGANCGACGFSGCDGYAAALAAGTAEIGLCSPGGPDVAEECATILGKAAGEMVRKVALVQCNGTCSNAGQKLIYDGVDTCQAVSLMFAGDSTCAYGCLGHGDCAAVCPEKAILVHDGLAMIDQDKCVGCGICTKVCPRGLFYIEDKKAKRKQNTCEFCLACAQNCPSKAIITKLKDANPNARYRHEKVSLKDIIEANQQV